MATVRYFVEKPGRNGPRYFWQPATRLIAEGWRTRRLANDRAQALMEAERLNAELNAWRSGEGAGPLGASRAATGTLGHAIAAFRADDEYRRLRPSTRRGYDYCAGILEQWAGDAPVRAIQRVAVKRLYQTIKRTHHAKANAVVRFARVLWGWLLSEDRVEANVAADVKLAGTGEKGRIWSPEAVAAFVAMADAMGLHSLGTAVAINAWLGQREGDVLALRRSTWAGGRLRIVQSKTGAVVDLPLAIAPRIAGRLEAELARQAARKIAVLEADAPLLICERTGRAWAADTFRHLFAAVRAAAVRGSNEHGLPPCPALEGLWFMHLRHTAIVRLAEAGCTIPEIAAITGHTLESATKIVDRYLVRTAKLADAAFQKRADAEGG